LLERIREIRASERRFYLKITDIYEQCSIDYDKDAEITKDVLSRPSRTSCIGRHRQDRPPRLSPNVRYQEAVHGTDDMEECPKGKILKSDVSVAKNYLIEQEIKELERIVGMYLDYAENQAARQIR